MSHQHRLETIDGKTLMNLSLPPLEFVVESFLPQGIHVLAGAPKIGKSWFALELCLAVASGEKFLGFNTVPTTALYLCLEDSIRRIRNRALELVEEIPATVHFALTADGIGGNLEKQIEEFVSTYPTAKQRQGMITEEMILK